MKGVKGTRGAIVPTLLHQIPSEIPSQILLGVSSARMRDHLGVTLHPDFNLKELIEKNKESCCRLRILDDCSEWCIL